MSGFRILLAMMIYTGEISDSEADQIHKSLKDRPMPDKPSQVLPTVRAELERIRAKQQAGEGKAG